MSKDELELGHKRHQELQSKCISESKDTAFYEWQDLKRFAKLTK